MPCESHRWTRNVVSQRVSSAVTCVLLLLAQHLRDYGVQVRHMYAARPLGKQLKVCLAAWGDIAFGVLSASFVVSRVLFAMCVPAYLV